MRCAWPRCKFLPAGNPPHRDQTEASAQMRLAMVRAAVEDEPAFSVDDREVRRTGLSYSVDTLTELRAENPDRSICLLLGMDAFLGLPGWHRWREIIGLAHIVVAHRPGWKAPTQGPLGEVMVDHGTGTIRELHELPAGRVLRPCGHPTGNFLDRAAAADCPRRRPSLPRAGQRLQGAARHGVVCSPAMIAVKFSRPPARAALVKLVAAALDDMKAANVKVMDVRKATDVADCMVIASGNSDRHVRSIADRVVERAKSGGFRPMGIEGERDGEWVLVDLNDVIVHVMLPRVREFYGLESLWDPGPRGKGDARPRPRQRPRQKPKGKTSPRRKPAARSTNGTRGRAPR